MAVAPGTRLGPYEVVGSLGAGGMGEVYRARDAKLQREVAIKVLPDAFAENPDRIMRFEREAQALAALNHPNVAQVFGVLELQPADDSGGRHGAVALVMELVEGQTLDDMIRGAGRGLPIADCLAIAVQIADGLEAAHERGIIHRDLKPANVRVRDDGTVKVLDFGLAKSLTNDRASSQAEEMNSPTITSPALTQFGVILGTAAYMAPEQARGRSVDRRADIWAFGCVLYEMLSGRRPFGGDDVSLMLAAILTKPVDFDALPADTDPAVRRLLRRCLERDPRKRLSSIGDARLELQDAIANPVSATVPSVRAPWLTSAMWALAGAVAASAIVVFTPRRPSTPPQDGQVVRSTLAFKVPLRLSGNRAFALNPAGTEIVFVGQVDSDHINLFRRRLDEEDAVMIAGTEGAEGPFFSPDGQWLAFVQHDRLKKMPSSGGAATELAPAAGSQGGAFAHDGSIVFNQHHGEGLERIRAGGTELSRLTTVDRAKGESGHHWPSLLPDGRHVLFTTEMDGKPYSEARIMLLSLDSGEQRMLIAGGSDAHYIDTGHIVYWREGALWRVPFDLRRLQVTGTAVAVLRDVMLGEPNGQAHYSIAGNGTLVYLTGRDVQSERGLMLVDRGGTARQLGDRRAFETVAVTPDGTRAAVAILAANDSLWLTDLDRPSFTRITFESENSRAVWSPDGSQIAFARHRGGETRRLFLMPADGSTPPEVLHESPRPEAPDSWVGDLVAFTRTESTGNDVWVLDMKTREAKPVLASRFTEVHPRFSPDGKWLAYASNESGQFEVYVRPYPGPGLKRMISTNGGNEPRWRGDGREIFYRTSDGVMAAEVTAGPPFSASAPRLLFKGTYRGEVNWPAWDALPNGQGFLLISDFAAPRTSVNMIQQWVVELDRKRPRRRKRQRCSIL